MDPVIGGDDGRPKRSPNLQRRQQVINHHHSAGVIWFILGARSSGPLCLAI
jgi:hypothetical protein